jgi:GT2 family glycosyltransferase
MPNKLVSIILLTWNGSRYLSECLDSVVAQRYRPLEIILIDNGSTDSSPGILSNYIPLKLTIPYKIEYLPINTGFARGMNRGISLSSGDYILTLNQDLVMNESYISDLIEELEKQDARLKGSAAGKILTWSSNFDNKNAVIDSAGHEIFTDRIVEGRGKGKPASQFDEQCTVFGVNAAAAIYSRSALEKVSKKGEIFDPDFFSYLEDIDLDYRLILKGYDSVFIPSALARHAGAGSGGRKSFMIRFRAHTNRYLIWIKNENISELLKDFVPILLQEVIQFLRTLFSNPLLFGSWFVFSSKARRAYRKRKALYPDGIQDYSRLRSFIRTGRLTGKLAGSRK